MYIVPVFVPHAGCTHACTFCNQRVISGQGQFNIDSVQEQLLTFVERLPIDKPKQVALYGGSFTALAMSTQQLILEHVCSMADKYNIVSIRVSTRPDCINETNLRLLAKYGVEVVELGVQSLNDSVLALARRGHTAEVVAPAVALLKQYGFQVGIQLMVGMQGQSAAIVQDTARQVAILRPDMVRIYSMMVLKGTELEARYLRGEFNPLSLDDSVEQAMYIWELMQASDIKVIRIGLQAEELLEDSIVAGEYHPAFGELVIQRHYLRVIQRKINDLQRTQGADQIYISYPHSMASKMVGMKKYNKIALQEQFAQLKIYWKVDNSVNELKIEH